MTPKQQLVAHLAEQHGEQSPTRRAPYQKLVLRHQSLHKRYLTHSHLPTGWTTGTDQTRTRIFLCPPKNPGATRNGDRNWVLQVTTPTSGWRCELAGTWEGDITGAQTAANKELGYEANWVLNTTGYGYEQKENAHD